MGAHAAQLFAHDRQRMLEQSQQCYWRERRIGGFGEQTEECSWRGVCQRLAGGIVDRDLPTLQFRRHAARQRAVLRHQRGCSSRRFQCLAQRQGDGQRFFGRVCRMDQGQTFKSCLDLAATLFGQRAPSVRRRRRAQRLAQHQFSRRVDGRLLPIRDILAPDHNAREQLFHAVLRMAGVELVPALFVEFAVEAWQHDHAFGQSRDRAE